MVEMVAMVVGIMVVMMGETLVVMVEEISKGVVRRDGRGGICRCTECWLYDSTHLSVWVLK
jgi:hypothetical protein